MFLLGQSGCVELLSNPNDLWVAWTNASGEQELQSAERLRQSEPCGLILVGDDRVGSDGLPKNLTPEIVFLCENQTQPDRYQ